MKTIWLVLLAVAIMLAFVALALPAQAHTRAEADVWMDDWQARVVAAGGVSVPLMGEYVDFRDRHLCLFTECVEPKSVSRSWSGGVEQWRPLVEAYFRPGDVDKALCIIGLESQGNPYAKNPRSSASGLWQHLASYWPERSAKAGVAGADIFDPEASTVVAAWLRYQGGGWSHWVVQHHC